VETLPNLPSGRIQQVTLLENAPTPTQWKAPASNFTRKGPHTYTVESSSK